MRRVAHRVVVSLPLLLLGMGCAHRVQVELPPAPAVELTTSQVAVVVADRSCRDVADALVDEVNRIEGIEVDPTAGVGLHVLECGRTMTADVDIRVYADDVDDAPGDERRRVSVVGRAHALVAVVAGGEAQAHLVGSARHAEAGAWGDLNVLGRGQATERALTTSLAEDLASQVSPMPRLVQRRVWPNAPEGTARRYHSDAVLAERSGRLVEALRLARKAHSERPTARTAAYLEELQQRLQRSGTDPTP